MHFLKLQANYLVLIITLFILIVIFDHLSEFVIQIRSLGLLLSLQGQKVNRMEQKDRDEMILSPKLKAGFKFFAC